MSFKCRVGEGVKVNGTLITVSRISERKVWLHVETDMPDRVDVRPAKATDTETQPEIRKTSDVRT